MSNKNIMTLAILAGLFGVIYYLSTRQTGEGTEKQVGNWMINTPKAIPPSPPGTLKLPNVGSL